MTKVRYVRSFSDPDEIVELGLLSSSIITFGGLTIAHDIHQPGWRWSTHMKPAVKTDSCQVRHIGMVLKGRLHVQLDDGAEFEAGPLELIDIPAGHDAWVVGDEPFELIGWGGEKTWMTPVMTLGERVLATLLLVDIVESTATAERMGATAWGELLADFQFRTRQIIEQYRGRIVDFAGDGVLASFDGAARAVRCAAALGQVAADLGLAVRAAVHVAEVELVEDTIRGVAIHEASRMLRLAQPGETLVSETIAVLARDAGMAFEDRGTHELKGLQGARRLFAARA